MYPCAACVTREAGRGSLLLLKKPTSPASPKVNITGEDSGARLRHARGIPAVPGIVIICAGCSRASVFVGVEGGTQHGSSAVVACALSYFAERAIVRFVRIPIYTVDGGPCRNGIPR